ncbi:MAG: Gfo/Idh/MocA family oxidoreductase [Chloroflexota bacterium]|nr:Gfo/Idh/MocA family oxidoreductase [Chloroflexota bacterium]MDE2929538.1 Gfo/Idh/MocA family oxidoreductase [Chloroflexota bacterium]
MDLRVAGIGAGRRAQAHYRALAQVEGAEVAAICDVDEGRAQEAAAPFGAETYSDYRDMLDTEQPDAVYVITPPNLHAEQVEYAATQKAAIFVEKPVALSVLDARRIRMAVEQGGVLCCVGYQHRYGSLASRARELMAGRELGMTRIWWYQGVPKVPWNLDSAQGGGQIVEQATHLLDLCRLFGGEVNEVYAQFGRSAWKEDESFQNWDVYSGVFVYKTCAVGSVATTYALFFGLPQSSGLDIVSEEMLLRFTGRGLEQITPHGTEFHDPEEPSSEVRMAQAFLQAVDANDPALIQTPLDDALKTLALTLAFNRSTTENRAVAPAEIEAEIFA